MKIELANEVDEQRNFDEMCTSVVTMIDIDIAIAIISNIV